MYSLTDVLNLASQHIGPFDGKQPSLQKASNPWMDNLFGFNDVKGNNNNIFKDAPHPSQKTAVIRQIFGSQYDPNTAILKTYKGNYRAGWFVSPTVKEIKDLIKSLPNLKKGVTELGIIQGRDVGMAIVNATALEVFQGASQMNALEMVNPDVIPNDGINIYVNDFTQGPRTALACAPGTLIRNYWLPMIYGSQYNMLENMNLSHLNGYLIWGTEPEAILYKLNEDQIKISSMLYTEVTGITVSDRQLEHRSNKLMHQIYSSAAPINTYRNGGNYEQQKEINRKLLTSQYIGIIGLSLILHYYDSIHGRTTLAKPRVNLTLVGGGVFNVPEDLIFESIQKAITYYQGYTFEVYLHGYSPETAQNISKYFNIPIGSLIPLKASNPQPSYLQPPSIQPHSIQPHSIQPHSIQPPSIQPPSIQPHSIQLGYGQPGYGQLANQQVLNVPRANYPVSGRPVGVLNIPHNMVQRYLIATVINGETKFYLPYNYQLNMLQELYRSPYDKINYNGRDDNGNEVRAILIKEWDRQGEPQFKFVTEKNETRYYVDATKAPITYYQQNPDSSWTLYDQYKRIINKWPWY